MHHESAAVGNHPQLITHAISLLDPGLTTPAIIHPSQLAPPNGVSTVGNPDAQEFWLNAARSIDWIKLPTVAHGLVAGDLVSWRSGAPDSDLGELT